MTIPAEWIETLRALDAATIYNIVKGVGRGEPGSFSGPELPSLFPRYGRDRKVAAVVSATERPLGLPCLEHDDDREPIAVDLVCEASDLRHTRFGRPLAPHADRSRSPQTQ
jgi:hypothetical protein